MAINFSEIGDTILEETFYFLDKKTRLRIERVHKKWYSAAHSKFAWSGLRQLDYEFESKCKFAMPFFDICDRARSNLRRVNVQLGIAIKDVAFSALDRPLSAICPNVDAINLSWDTETIFWEKSVSVPACTKIVGRLLSGCNCLKELSVSLPAVICASTLGTVVLNFFPSAICLKRLEIGDSVSLTQDIANAFKYLINLEALAVNCVIPRSKYESADSVCDIDLLHYAMSSLCNLKELYWSNFSRCGPFPFKCFITFPKLECLTLRNVDLVCKTNLLFGFTVLLVALYYSIATVMVFLHL